MWSEQPANYSNLRVFGCMAYAHIRQDKLAARAIKCIFIGYPDGVKGFKVWNLESTGTRCFNTRDVTFDKTKMGYVWRHEAEGNSQHKNDS